MQHHREYVNEAFVDFNQADNRRQMKQALEKVGANLGQEYELVIGGKRFRTEDKIISINPANKDQVVGKVAKATEEHAEMAIQTALTAFDTWKFVDANERARYLFKTAAIMRRRKFEFSSWMVYEAGKNWLEADADTAEAIDFLEFYGREMIRLADRQPLIRYPGEENELSYIPLGVGIIIPPWNFPLAIMAGMTSAAIVSGNTVVLKPASSTPVIAAKFVELLQEAGLPDGVVNYLPGSGGAIGDYLVGHPKTRFINFTGSRDVGLHINELASKIAPGQIWIKRVIAEMGGKDAIVVDQDTNLDEAAQGIVMAAFGFSGQKCSACSRAIIHRDVYDEVLSKCVEMTKGIKIGNPVQEETYLGPVVDEGAYHKILEYIEIGKNEGRLATGGSKAEGNGFFIQPTIIADVDSKARVAQEEIFGPVVAFIRANTFDHALEIANDTEYGLTGAVYSRNRKHLERARKEFHVGNLYFNRKCTGALVGVQPFGGFNMSGTDSKAGGRDYLLLFTQAKVVSEKL